MELVAIKRTVKDKKHGVILEPFFGRNMTVLYYTNDTMEEGKSYKVKMSKDIIPAGNDVRGIPIFIRKCAIIEETKE